VTQQRAGEQPASAPKTSQESPRAQTRAKFKIPTLKQADSRHEDRDAPGLRDGSKDTTRIIIHGRHSPPISERLTTHATWQRQQHPIGPTTSPWHGPMLLSQPVRYHSFGEGYVQVRSAFGPEPGTELLHPPRQEAEAQLQYSQSLTQLLHHKSMALTRPTRNHPFGEGYVQPCSAFGPEYSTEQQQLHQTEMEAMLQHPKSRTEISPMPPLQHARYHSLGEGHGHACSVLGPERGAETQQPQQYGTIDLQHIRDDGKTAQKLAESCIWRHGHSYVDSDTHSMHYTSPAVQHSLKQIESLQSATEGKTALEASSSWSAQVQPFGNGHRHTDTTPGPVQSNKRSSQISATQERQWQTLHHERAAANLGPRSYPTGDSFAQKPENDKATNFTKDAPRIDKINNTTVLPHVRPLAEGCGRLAEFLAQTPWEEKKNRPGGYPARRRATPEFPQLLLPPGDTDVGRPTNRGHTHDRGYKTPTTI